MSELQLRPKPWLKIYNELGVSEPIFDNMTLAQHVEQHAREIPDFSALQYIDCCINYGELNSWSNRFANLLKDQGVKKGDIIGIHLANCPQYLIAIIAASKLGCVVSGISPLLVPVEVAYQINDAGINCLLTSDELFSGVITPVTDKFETLQSVIVTRMRDFLDVHNREGNSVQSPSLESCRFHSIDYLAAMATMSNLFESVDSTPEDTFFVQYTGGTTGRSKGAELSIHNVMYNCVQFTVYRQLTLGKETLASAFPLFHIAGVCVNLLSLINAARILVIPDPRDLDHFIGQMKKYTPTILCSVPTLYKMLREHNDFDGVDFSELKLATTGAAPMPLEERIKLEKIIGAGMLSDTFGMTETGPVHVCNPPMRGKPTSVGIPVLGGDTRIVDIETGSKEMPLGEPGEIITSGPQVMKGYHNLPEENAIALRELNGKTWMFTGDVGFMDDEGYIYLCDRAKDMLIVGGYKVFSVEIEDKLKELEFVSQSAIIGHPDIQRSGSDIVYLYVELDKSVNSLSHEFLKEKIINFCRKNMAPYKIPKSIEFIDSIPLTSVGKIDKKKLRQFLLAKCHTK